MSFPNRLCGMNHTLLFSPKRDALYKLGGNEPYYPSTGGSERIGAAPVDITATLPFPVNTIKQLQVCNSYNLYLLEDGRLFGSESNQFGQLGFNPVQSQGGFSHTKEIIEIPFSGPKIKMISGGIAGCTLVLTEDGDVYSCGEFNGRPGDMRWGLHQIPRAVFKDESVSHVSVGGCVAIFITVSGAVYTIGVDNNSEGDRIVGHEECERCVTIPRRLDSLWEQGVRAVTGSAGRLHGIIIDQNGHLYGWGSNVMGQLGLPLSASPNPIYDVKGNSHLPKRLIPQEEGGELVKFKHIVCTWTHSIAISVDGVAYSLGRYYNPSEPMGYLGRTSTLMFDRMTIDSSRIVAYADAGGGHTLLLLNCENEETDTYIATCGSGRNDQLGGNGRDDTFVKVRGNDVRQLPLVMNWQECCFTSKRPRIESPEDGNGRMKKGRTNVVSKDRRQQYEEEEEEDEDDYEDEDDEDDDDIPIYIRIDYGDVRLPRGEVEVAADSFSDLYEKACQSPDVEGVTIDENTSFHLLICNHYVFAKLSSLTDSLASKDMRDKFSSAIVGITFVSCTLYATPDDVSIFVDTLASYYPKLNSITLDSTILTCNWNEGQDDEDITKNESMVTFCEILPIKLLSLRELYLEGLGNESIISLTLSMIEAHNSSLNVAETSRPGLKKLTVDSARFDEVGFEAIGNMLNANPILQALHLPKHEHINDDNFQLLVNGLSHNTHLQVLDVHVVELGHMGVTSKGIDALVQFLETKESKKTSVLSALDVSGDDGAPDITKKLQRRLNACLLRNAQKETDEKRKKHLKKLSQLPVYQCHSEDY